MVAFFLLMTKLSLAQTCTDVVCHLTCNDDSFARSNKIYCKIKLLQPFMDNDEAMELSNYLYSYSRQYGTDPMISVGILYVENTIKNRDKKKRGYVFYKECETCQLSYHIEEVSTDIGYFQFHINTIEYYNINPLFLKLNLQYNVEQHIILLKKKMNECKLKTYPWACWHSATPKLRNEYANKVLNALRKK